MWVAVLVRHLMMAPVNCRPASRATLQRCGSAPGQHSSQPTGRNESPMRKQSMVANADRKGSNEIKTEEENHIHSAGPEPKCKQACGVQHNYKKTVGPVKT